MDVDNMMLFQELAFTVGLSVLIYFILCKFHSNLSQENSMAFCCVDQREDGNSMVDQREDELERDKGVVGGEEEIVDKVFDESPMRRELNEIEADDPDYREIQIELGEIEGSGAMGNEILAREGREDHEDGLFDDWEGIERTELEKDFGAAVVFVDSKGNADQLDNDVKLQLYGLHKVATDGPCCRTQPLAVKLSARAKWNAWQRLGEISREEAMEQYITLLSKSVNDWKD